jgi:hypothetical protein
LQIDAITTPQCQNGTTSKKLNGMTLQRQKGAPSQH